MRQLMLYFMAVSVYLVTAQADSKRWIRQRCNGRASSAEAPLRDLVRYEVSPPVRPQRKGAATAGGGCHSQRKGLWCSKTEITE